MTVEIKYQSKIKNETISSYLHQWATKFDDMVLIKSDIEYSIISSTKPSPPVSGRKIAAASSHLYDQKKAAIVTEFVATINIDIEDSLDQHLTPDISGSLELGENLFPTSDLKGIEFEQLQLQKVQLEFSGLDIADDITNSIYTLSHVLNEDKNYQGGANLGIYNLLRGNAEPILIKLEAQGIDVNTPLKDMAIASQFDITSDIMAETLEIETVGVPQELLAA
ncbi:hemophore protein [Yersinia rochesterensis]|uniref:heme acquisition protein HasA n=1 Tax=Yersinia TaxID=629 RepID=UPI002240D3E8|nr:MULTISPECIES: heme acquisition protein HasA [Yersinia]MDA5545957.1 hemophore protein [Yersinia rochesterensis]UZM74974.1 heme acquisition protein HasA [Yersinia sp. SCPM-O-B-9106 (C-191)]